MSYLFRFIVNNLKINHNYGFFLTNYTRTNFHPVLKDQICNCSTSPNNEVSNDESLMRLLLNYGFKCDDLSNFIQTYPEIRKLPEDRLNSILRTWNQLGENNTISLLLKHPGLMFIKRNQIDNFIKYFYKKYNTQEIMKLLLNAPKSVLSDVDLIDEKMNYLENVMLVSKNEIINTDTLELTLHKIKERYEFLRRLGIYKTVNDKKDIYYRNPKLVKIMSTSDEEFATKIAGVTLYEYEVFQQLFVVEELDE